MHLSRTGLLAVLAVASGAALAAPPQEMTALRGQPVETVIAKLGPPASQQTTGGATTYVWTMQFQVDMATRTTRTDYSAGRPNTNETIEMRPQMQSCTLSVVADGAGVITDADQQGPYQACSELVDKLTGQR
jgi:phosphate-selective porin